MSHPRARERGRPQRGRAPLRRAALALAATMLLGTGDAHAWCQLRTGPDRSSAGVCEVEGEPMAWPNRCLSYSVDTRGSDTFSAADLERITAAAFANWSTFGCDAAPFPLAFRADAPRECNLGQHRNSGPNVHTVAFAEEWTFDASAFAVTTVWNNANTGEILDADILINPNQGPYAECPEEGCVADDSGVVASDLESILTHEVGHFLGLAHSQFGFATMHASAARGEAIKRSISSDDNLGVCAIYPPEASAPACTDELFEPRGGLAELCKPQSGCSTGGAGGAWWLLLIALLLRSHRSTRR
ncbi:MAG: matrixin family metalloprotease [Myxococcota bacterium]